MGLPNFQEHVSTPRELSSLLPPLVDCTAGRDHILALAEDGTLYAWGGNGHGQCGRPQGSFFYEPVVVPLPDPPAKLACGLYFSAAVTLSGSLLVWGEQIVTGEGGKKKVKGGSGKREVPPHEPTEIRKCVKNLVCGRYQVFATHVDDSIWFGGKTADFRRPLSEIIPKGVKKGETPKNDHGEDVIGVIQKKDIAFIGMLTRMCFIMTKDGNMYPIGDNKYLFRKTKLNENAKFSEIWKLPFESLSLLLWEVLRWFFLGNKDSDSELFILPVEITFHVVQVLIRTKQSLLRIPYLPEKSSGS
jgi:hypothetical protein